MADKGPVDRRRFFRAGLRELLKPLAGAIEPYENAMKQLQRFEDRPAPQPPAPQQSWTPPPAEARAWLRPPGSVEEQAFRETCSRCGECVKVCPAACIHIDPTGNMGAGAPYIIPDEMPCVLCDGLVCMRGCPSGAIQPTALFLIDMGTALWHADRCTRTTAGDDCQACVERCPVGTQALSIRGREVVVGAEHCTGCGVCQNSCPTAPKSIEVIPKSARS